MLLLGGLLETGPEGVADEGLVGGKAKIFPNVLTRIALASERFEVCSLTFFIYSTSWMMALILPDIWQALSCLLSHL